MKKRFTVPASHCSAISAVLAPTGSQKSRRQERLSQEARDVLACAFAIGVPACNTLPIPMTAAEVFIGPGDVHNILMGGGFHRHGGTDSNDCNGDPERGKAIIAGYVRACQEIPE